MLRLIVLNVCFLVGTSLVVKFSYNTPRIPIRYKADSAQYQAALDLYHNSAFFYGPKCKVAEVCDLNPITQIYDPDLYKPTKLDTFYQVYENEASSVVEGTEYEGYLSSAVLGEFNNFKLPVVDKIDPMIMLGNGSLIGLGFETNLEDDNPVRQLFGNYPIHQVIFRRGPFGHKLKDRQIDYKKVKGRYIVGETKAEGCGDFQFFKTTPGKGWTLTGALKIGTDTYSKIEMKFKVDESTFVSEEIHNKHFKSVTKDEDIPDFAFAPDGVTNYPMKKENMARYAGNKEFRVGISTKPETTFVLGDSFLATYCLSIRVDDKFENPEIGLAVASDLPEDPQWEKIEDGGKGEDGGKDGGGGGGGGDKGGDGGKDGGGKGGKGGKGDGDGEDGEDGDGDKGGKGGKGGKKDDNFAGNATISVLLSLLMLIVHFVL